MDGHKLIERRRWFLSDGSGQREWFEDEKKAKDEYQRILKKAKDKRWIKLTSKKYKVWVKSEKCPSVDTRSKNISKGISKLSRRIK